MIGEQNKKKIETRTFEELVDIFTYVKVDYRIQRMSGLYKLAGWNSKNREDYIESAYQENVLNSITWIDISETLDFFKNHPDKKKYRKDIEYFQNLLDEGFIYLSIDGNNTNDTIYHYVKDIIPDKDGKKFSEIDKDVQNSFLNTPLTVNILHGKTKKECGSLFQKCNTQKELNRQQWRRCNLTDFSNWVFELNNKWYRPLHFFSISEKDMDSALGEETIAMLYAELANRDSIEWKALHSLYEEIESPNISIKQRVENIFKNINKQISEIEEEKIKKSEKNIARLKRPMKRTLFLVYLLCLDDYLNKQKKEIDIQKFFDQFDYLQAIFVKEAEKILKEDEEQKSWIFWLGNFSNKRRLQKCKAKMLEELLNKEGEFVIEKSSRGSKERFTPEDHAILIAEQKWVDRKGNPIDQIDRRLGFTEVDHVISVKNGGKTEITNAEVMRTEDNRKKGSKNNEPHFPHQLKATAK